MAKLSVFKVVPNACTGSNPAYAIISTQDAVVYLRKKNKIGCIIQHIVVNSVHALEYVKHLGIPFEQATMLQMLYVSLQQSRFMQQIRQPIATLLFSTQDAVSLLEKINAGQQYIIVAKVF